MALTPKMRDFAMAFIETQGNRAEAYRRAYDASRMKDKTVYKRASELMDNGEVAGFIEELQAKNAEKHEITVERIRDMLIEDRAFARECGSAAACVAATNGLAKLYGHGGETHKHKHEHNHQGEIKMTAEERRNMLADRLREHIAKHGSGTKELPPPTPTSH